ncbi:MAG: M48 family metalloprotease [Deltaproteobacteria bacterium]|jgi:predicted Zn-dependent protease|nr:M48 family metalloprotease [Deltaproteobacteria bacterium]
MGYCLSPYNGRPKAAFRAVFQGRPVLFPRPLVLFLLICFLAQSAFFPARAAIFGEFTLKDELELGRKFNILIRTRMPLVQDPEVVDYITEIVARLAKNIPPQPYPFTTSVIRHNALNAFACPGGYIFVHTGLILAMRHESELAAVIAHELAHISQRHIGRRIEQSQIVGLLSLLGALAGAFIGGEGGAAAMTGAVAAGQAAILSYSRSDEAEADQVGMNYLVKAGYPAQGMVGAFEIIGRRQWFMGSTLPSYLSTHPGVADRIQDMSIRLRRLPASLRNQKDSDSRFLRVQALTRARYSPPEIAEQAFAEQMNTDNRCMALMGQGILDARLNHVPEAGAAFQEAMACDPQDELIIREAGRFHYTKGNRNTGARLLQQAVSMNRKDIMAIFFYARCLGDAGNNKLAIDYTREVLRAVPEDAEVHTLLAHYYGADKQMFNANLHMAYGALYENNRKRVEQFFGKAKDLAKTADEKARVERFSNEYKDRQEFW